MLRAPGLVVSVKVFLNRVSPHFIRHQKPMLSMRKNALRAGCAAASFGAAGSFGSTVSSQGQSGTTLSRLDVLEKRFSTLERKLISEKRLMAHRMRKIISKICKRHIGGAKASVTNKRNGARDNQKSPTAWPQGWGYYGRLNRLQSSCFRLMVCSRSVCSRGR